MSKLMEYGTEKAAFHSSAALPASLWCLNEYITIPIPHMSDEMHDASISSCMLIKMSDTHANNDMASVYFLICSPCVMLHL